MADDLQGVPTTSSLILMTFDLLEASPHLLQLEHLCYILLRFNENVQARLHYEGEEA